jgi:hypothetical protein
MADFYLDKNKNNNKVRRLDNRLLYFLAFKLPLNSSYSNRTMTNYFNILIIRNEVKHKKNSSFSDDLSIIHNLVINNIFKFYLEL